MRFPALVSLLTLSVLSGPSRAVAPMEPASRTLFVFVHGINPKSSGAIEGDMAGKGGNFCTDRNNLRGRASYVWLSDLKEEPSDRSIFCSMRSKLFPDSQFSLRAFSNPGESPVVLAHELGDRTWAHQKGLRSHVVEAMDRYLQVRLASARSKSEASRSSFESLLVRLHPTGSALNLRGLFHSMPDSVPSRVVVFAHSMGGLTTREYLASDYFNGDLDKVVTYDTPHRGSWVAKYNSDGVGNPLQFVIDDGMKFAIGGVLLGSDVPGLEMIGAFYMISGGASFTSRLATNFAGFIANKFLGDEKGNTYLTPSSSSIRRLNAMASMPCEANGCKIPRFFLNGVDGILAPDDPDKFVGSGPIGFFVPKEGLNAAQAVVMSYGRDWPTSVTRDIKLGAAIVAMSFAFGDWNYTQHGSLPVPLNSSRADGIPFLSRPDVRANWRVVDWYDEALQKTGVLKDLVARWSSSVSGLSGLVVALEAYTILGNTVPMMRPTTALGKFGLVAANCLTFPVDMGAYSTFAGKSHNANVWLNATRELTDTVYRPDGAKTVLRFLEAESDLYERPFVNIASERGVDTTGDSVHFLHISSGKQEGRMAIPARKLQGIRYETQG